MCLFVLRVSVLRFHFIPFRAWLTCVICWQGRTTAGAFQLVVDDKIEKIEAHVEMMFNEHRSYEHTNVCLMDRLHSDPPAMGLGIYVS